MSRKKILILGCSGQVGQSIKKVLKEDYDLNCLDRPSLDFNALKKLQKEYGISIIFITHDLGVIAQIADRVVVMYGGKVQEIAEINELFENPLHPYTKALMNSIPKMDIKEKRLQALKGMVPTVFDMGDKCKLCSRFDSTDCACGGTGKEPDIFEIKPNHFVRCNPIIFNKK